MPYTLDWKENTGTPQKLSNKDPSTASSAPRFIVYGASVDVDGSSPLVCPGVTPQPRPTRKSTRDAIGYRIVVFCFFLLHLLVATEATTQWAMNSVKLIDDLDVPEVVIAIMGATGCGKSTFANLVSGSNLVVGGGLRSCTRTIQLAGSFELDGHRVILIDTPGFDDTTRSDTDVLRTITAFLATSYERGSTLAGVLYFHRISDYRMGGVSTRNFNMFKKLCGESTLRNVVVVTNMWGEVDPWVGDAREAELMNDELFFKPVLDKGARMARHNNTIASAENIIRLVLDNHPLPLRIQVELVNERKDISETGAGEELNVELNAQLRKYQEEIRILKEELEWAMGDKDEETRRELEYESRRIQEEVERVKKDAERFATDYRREKERLETRLVEVESMAREEADRVAAQYQQQIDGLRNSLKTDAAASEKDKALSLDKIGDLSKKRDHVRTNPYKLGVLSMIEAMLDGYIPL